MKHPADRLLPWLGPFIFVIFYFIQPTLLSSQGGPGSPESQTSSASNLENLANLFTGDFQYTIPLLDVGNFPVSLSYNSNIGSYDQASWVGLGRSLNPGSVNRAVRGLSDDFNGNEIQCQVSFNDGNKSKIL